MVSLVLCVGIGNIVGVVVVIYLGGVGVVFWMWVVVLVGMVMVYFESVLVQFYKVYGDGGMYCGGLVYYILKGLGLLWLGVVFVVVLIFVFGLVFNLVQLNFIVEVVNGVFGVLKWVVGFVIVGLMVVIIFGGILQVVCVVEIVVLFMVGIYLLVVIIVIVMNLIDVLWVLWQIVGGVFGLIEVVGGVVGLIMVVVMNGIKCGLFLNEVGMGLVLNIVVVVMFDLYYLFSQGFVQVFGVFIDMIFVCMVMVVMIILLGVMQLGSGIIGMVLMQNVLVYYFGVVGGIFVVVVIFFFVFILIIGNYVYVENVVFYLGFGNKIGLMVLWVVVVLMVVWGVI